MEERKKENINKKERGFLVKITQKASMLIPFVHFAWDDRVKTFSKMKHTQNINETRF